MKLLFAAICAASCLTMTGAAFAQNGEQWSLDRRESWLETSLDRGVANGSVSQHESMRIHQKLSHIHDEQMAATARNGGRLPDEAMQKLEAELDKTAQDIHWMKADHETRPW